MNLKRRLLVPESGVAGLCIIERADRGDTAAPLAVRLGPMRLHCPKAWSHRVEWREIKTCDATVGRLLIRPERSTGIFRHAVRENIALRLLRLVNEPNGAS